MNKNNKFVITINRELGSGGRTVGRKLAELLGVKYYDKAIVQGLTEKYGLTAEEIERLKAQEKPSWWSELQDRCKSLLSANSQPKPSTSAMFETERRILEQLASQESCVVAGRSGFLIFREHPNHLNVFIQASTEHRIELLMKKQGLTMLLPSTCSTRLTRVARLTSRSTATVRAMTPATTMSCSLWIT